MAAKSDVCGGRYHQKGVVAAYSEHERELIVEALHRLERSDLVDELIYLDCNAKKCFRKCFPEDLMRIQQRLRRRFDRGLMTRRRRRGAGAGAVAVAGVVCGVGTGA